MIRIIFIVIAFLMLVGAGVGGLYFWGIDPLEKLGPLVGRAPKSDVPVVTPPSYVDFGILIVPVIQDREIKKQVEMIVRLEVPASAKSLVATNLPRLQHAYLQDMMGYLSLSLRDGQQIDVEAVRKRLLAVGDKVMGQGQIKDVIIETPSLK